MRLGATAFTRKAQALLPGSSAGEAAFFKKGGLFRSGGPPKRGVSVGEPAKAGDNLLVDLCEAEALPVPGLLCMGPEEAQAQILVLERLGMLKRQVEEGTQQRLNLTVKASLYGGSRHGSGLAIRGIGMGAAAVEVARKLVEQDGQGKRALGSCGPGVVPTGGGPVMDRLELEPDRLIEGVRSGEPPCWTG